MATKICPRCGAENNQKAEYCVRCGTVLDAAGNAAPNAQASPEPRATKDGASAQSPAGAAPAHGASGQHTGPADPAQAASRQSEPPCGSGQGASVPQYTYGQWPPESAPYQSPYGQPDPAPYENSPGQQNSSNAQSAYHSAQQSSGPQNAYQAGNPQYTYQAPGQPGGPYAYPYPPREQHPFGQPDRIFGWYDGTFAPDAASPARSRIAGGVLAILLGLFGIHKFYLGQWGAGLIYLLITLFFAWHAGWIVGLLFLYNLTEAILLFTMRPEEFQNKYHVRAE